MSWTIILFFLVILLRTRKPCDPFVPVAVVAFRDPPSISQARLIEVESEKEANLSRLMRCIKIELLLTWRLAYERWLVIRLDHPLHHGSIVELKRVLASAPCSPTVVGHLRLRHGRLITSSAGCFESKAMAESYRYLAQSDSIADQTTRHIVRSFTLSLKQLDYCPSMASEGLPVICRTMEVSHMPCYVWQEHVHSCSFPLGVTCHAILDTVFSTIRWDGRLSLTFSVDCPLPD